MGKRKAVYVMSGEIKKKETHRAREWRKKNTKLGIDSCAARRIALNYLDEIIILFFNIIFLLYSNSYKGRYFTVYNEFL